MRYLLGERDHNGEIRPRHQIIGGTLSGETARDIARELGAFHALRPGLKNHLVHMSLRTAPGDRALSDDEWRKIGDTWAKSMGFQAYAIVSHGDHVHLACSRLRGNGSVVSDSNDYRRSEAIIRQLEAEHELQKVESSHLLEPGRAETHRKAPGLAEISTAERGERPRAEVLRDLLDSTLADRPPVTAFLERLEAAGVEVRPNVASTGRLSGFAYGLDGQIFTAKSLGRRFTLSNMQKGGLSYEPDRDAAAIKRASSHATIGTSDASDAENRQYGSDSKAGRGERRPSDSAASSGGGKNDQPGASGIAGNREPSRNGESENTKSAAYVGLGSEIGSDGRERSRESPVSTMSGNHSTSSGNPAPNPTLANAIGRGAAIAAGSSGGAAMAGGTGLSDDDGTAPDPKKDIGAYFRWWARALAKKNAEMNAISKPKVATSTAPIFRQAGMPRLGPAIERVASLSGVSSTPATKRTIDNVRRQIEAFRAVGVELFEIQPIAPKGITGLKTERARTWTAEQACDPKNIAWLRRENAIGYGIYIRPAPREDGLALPLSFMDDMSAEMVKEAEGAGISFAVLSESSPGNYQGWPRLGDQPISRELLTECGRELCRRFKTDPGAIDWRRHGRFSGFTNTKPERRGPNGSPFSLMRKCCAEVSELGGEILEAAKAAMKQSAHEQKRKAERRDRAQHFGSYAHLDNATKSFLEARVRHAGPDKSKSARDFSAAMAMFNAGFDTEQVRAALAESRSDFSPYDLENEKGYVARTVARAEEYAHKDRRPSAYRPRR